MRTYLDAIIEAVDLRDLHVYPGIAGIVYGLEQIRPGLGFAVGGLLLFYMGVFQGREAHILGNGES